MLNETVIQFNQLLFGQLTTYIHTHSKIPFAASLQWKPSIFKDLLTVLNYTNYNYELGHIYITEYYLHKLHLFTGMVRFGAVEIALYFDRMGLHKFVFLGKLFCWFPWNLMILSSLFHHFIFYDFWVFLRILENYVFA